MKIVVCVKQVPDTKGGVKFNPDGTLDRGAMLTIMNPDDKAGLEAALRIKDEYGAEVTVLTMGLPKAEDVLREAIAMGADNAQTLKAIREAEAYPGPSLIIAYAPCINHGLKRKGGMGRSQHEEELAVECGYWHLWRYNPLLADEGKNPFTLDSKAPNWENFRDFLLGEVRYLSVQKAFPKEADELFSQAEKMAKLRYQTYVRKSQEDWSEQI